MPAHNRPKTLARVLERIWSEPVAEVIVVDNGSSVDLAPITERTGARLVRSPTNVGVAARNIAADLAAGELLLMLDDDSYPQPGTVAALRDLFIRSPRLGALGGRVVDVDEDDLSQSNTGTEVGSFDWFARYGSSERDQAKAIPSFFFPEGASMVRRSAYQEVGGCFEPYFGELTELDLATRLLAAGWDVRYLPTAHFDHLRTNEWRGGLRKDLRLRVRNQVWYFWRHFPALLALRRILAYLAFDFLECAYRGLLRSWLGGVLDAWRQRRLIQGTRRPLARETIRRIELSRGRAHGAVLLHGFRSSVRKARKRPDA